jgi:hypothetical protein
MNIKARFAGAAVLASLACASTAGAPASAADYTLTVLQDVGGQGYSQATGINASGQIVGYSSSASGDEAVLCSSSGVGTALADVGGTGRSYATGINASGQIVGESDTASGTDAVLWSSSGTGRAWSA